MRRCGVDHDWDFSWSCPDAGSARGRSFSPTTARLLKFREAQPSQDCWRRGSAGRLRQTDAEQALEQPFGSLFAPTKRSRLLAGATPRAGWRAEAPRGVDRWKERPHACPTQRNLRPSTLPRSKETSASARRPIGPAEPVRPDQASQRDNRIGPERQPSPDLGDMRCHPKDGSRDPDPLQRDCGGKSANAATDDQCPNDRLTGRPRP